jgi:quercetin dioxygenase-like cupin family protein
LVLAKSLKVALVFSPILDNMDWKKIITRRNYMIEATSTQSEKSLTSLVRTDESEWTPLAEPGVSGIYIKPLLFDEATHRAPTFLLKFEAGATYPAHNHPGGEEIFVIEGDIKLGKDHLHKGDYLYTAPNGKHAVWSQNGCIVLLKVPEAVEILKP